MRGDAASARVPRLPIASAVTVGLSGWFGAAVAAREQGKPLECEAGPGTVAEKMLEAFEIARHVAVHEGYADAGIHGESTILPDAHVGGGIGVEESPPAMRWQPGRTDDAPGAPLSSAAEGGSA